MQENKLKEAIDNILEPTSIRPYEQKKSVESIYTLISDVCVKFAEWIGTSWVDVSSNELKMSAWVNYKDHDVLTHGSDYHFTKLIREYGKTTQCLFDYFINHIYKTK